MMPLRRSVHRSSVLEGGVGRGFRGRGRGEGRREGGEQRDDHKRLEHQQDDARAVRVRQRALPLQRVRRIEDRRLVEEVPDEEVRELAGVLNGVARARAKLISV